MSEEENRTPNERKGKGKARGEQTPARIQVNRPPEAIAQSSIESARRYAQETPVTSRAGAEVSEMLPTPVTPAGREYITDMFNEIKVKVSSQHPSSAKGRKSDKPLKMDKVSHGMNTPTQYTKVVVIDSDSDEEVMEVPNEGRSSQHEVFPLTAESSQSSVDSVESMFPKLQISSSMSSIESVPSPTFSKASTSTASTVTPARPAKPVFEKDIFTSSPNVTYRHHTPKKLKSSSSAAPTPVRLPPLNTSLPAIARASSVPKEPEVYIPDSDAPKTVPASVLAFSQSAIGTQLDTTIIAHNDEVQVLFDRYRISWGTQYELSRGVTAGAWTWEDVRKRVNKLKGSNADAAWKVKAVMRDQPEPNAPGNLNLWKELDREQKSIEENTQRGLGLCGDFEGAKDWYGGQIQQLGRLAKTDEGSFKIVLEELEKRRSHRFARYYGSRRFFQVKIPTTLLQEDNDAVKQFLIGKFVLNGRVFVPFHSREEGLYMVETDEDYRRGGAKWGGDAYRVSFNEFVNWHNPIEKNWEQVISKYATRFALGLSNSVPALEFDEKNIFFIDDITSEDWPKGKPNPPADKLMTDGCGFMNHAALRRIVKALSLESVPAGVQGRIDGSKGFWILHPSDDSPDPKIWIRTSQHKIKNRSFDRAHRIFDHLGPSKPTPPSAITAQSIVNLCSNNIPQSLLVKMMQEGLESEIMPFLDWEGPNAMLFLAHAISKTGNVTSARTQRLAAALNRALGLKGRDWGSQRTEMVDEEELDDDDTIALTGRNKYSGAPSSFHEMALEMVQAGFNPRYSKILAEKIKYIISSTIDKTVEKYRIPIEESLGAYVVPDPLDVLGEGEIYYKFSTARKNPRTDMLVHELEGDVVLGRYPIRLPSDMQKVKAVKESSLEKWPDVVIVSTKGKRSLASLLADGDMDGDELIAIWDPEIVEHFQNKDFTSAPDDLMDNFDRDVVRVEEFCSRVTKMPQKQASEAFQSVLLANLAADKVGLYSSMHDKAVIKYGYGSPEAIRLAYIFNTLLDASKSGRRLKAGVFEADQKKYSFISQLQNPRNPHILDVLRAAAQQKGEELRNQYTVLYKAQGYDGPPADKHLLKPYNDEADYALKVYKVAPQFIEELKLIRSHVDTAHNLWKTACAKEQMKRTISTGPSSPMKKIVQPQKKKGARKDVMLTATREYAAPIEGVLMVRQLEQVKASYAYQLSENFALSVAFQEICHIKAMSSPGGIVAILREFDEAKTFAPGYMRVLNRRDEDY